MARPYRDMIHRSTRAHIWLCCALIFGLLGGGTVVAALTEISGAVVAAGQITVESNVKRVQHPDGGIVSRVRVRNGDLVRRGDVLIEFDDQTLTLSLKLADKIYIDKAMLEARILADLAGLDRVPDSARLSALSDRPEIAQAHALQQATLDARIKARGEETAQIAEQIAQFETQLSALATRDATFGEELAILEAQATNARKLMERQLINVDRVDALRRDLTRVKGARAGNRIDTERVGELIAEKRIEMSRVESIARARNQEDLVTLKTELDRLEAERVQSGILLERLHLRAPQDGFVHNLAIHTVGAVVQPGELLVELVPLADNLVLDLNISPIDIDSIETGQPVSVSFPGLDQRSTPRLRGQVEVVSADLVKDPATGDSFYTTKVRLTPGEAARLGDKRLVPGMPVLAFIETSKRSVLDYLVGPLTEQLNLALKEP